MKKKKTDGAKRGVHPYIALLCCSARCPWVLNSILNGVWAGISSIWRPNSEFGWPCRKLGKPRNLGHMDLARDLPLPLCLSKPIKPEKHVVGKPSFFFHPTIQDTKTFSTVLSIVFYCPRQTAAVVICLQIWCAWKIPSVDRGSTTEAFQSGMVVRFKVREPRFLQSDYMA